MNRITKLFKIVKDTNLKEQWEGAEIEHLNVFRPFSLNHYRTIAKKEIDEIMKDLSKPEIKELLKYRFFKKNNSFPLNPYINENLDFLPNYAVVIYNKTFYLLLNPFYSTTIKDSNYFFNKKNLYLNSLNIDILSFLNIAKTKYNGFDIKEKEKPIVVEVGNTQNTLINVSLNVVNDKTIISYDDTKITLQEGAAYIITNSYKGYVETVDLTPTGFIVNETLTGPIKDTSVFSYFSDKYLNAFCDYEYESHLEFLNSTREILEDELDFSLKPYEDYTFLTAEEEEDHNRFFSGIDETMFYQEINLFDEELFIETLFS